MLSLAAKNLPGFGNEVQDYRIDWMENYNPLNPVILSKKHYHP
jgi:hypothetical protein